MPASADRVLLVEDEKDISDLMALHLKRDGFHVLAVDNGEAALKAMETDGFTCLVLDWMLPGLSGLELCGKIRAGQVKAVSPSIPILMVTARVHSADIVQGLEAGADDYLTKPFDLAVFRARIQALLRRAREGKSARSKEPICLGALTIDVERHQVKCKSKELSLTPSEFKLLVALAGQEGRVLTRDRLIDLVQGEGVSVVDRAIDTHIFGLRKKLGSCADLVETVRGIGYRVRRV